MINRDEERDLILRAQKGDQRSLDQLLEISRPKLRVYISGLGLSSDDCEDLIQRCYLRAVRGLPNFEMRSSFHNWLVIIAKHLYLDYLRKCQRQPSLISLSSDVILDDGNQTGDSISDILPDNEPQPLDQIIYQELISQISETLDELGSTGETTRLSILEEWEYDEMREYLDIPLGTLKSRLFRGRQKLQKILV